MFTPKRSNTLTPSSSARVTRSQSLKTKYEMSPRVSTSGAINTSLIYSDNLMESYKSPLPLKVTEIISQSNLNELSQINANIMPNGHVCFMTEKRAYIWKLKKSTKNIQCSELTLPTSKAKIKANCFHVECYNNKDYVAICVTAEGSIRYWPSIFNEFLCIDSKCDLAANDEPALISLISKNRYMMLTGNGQLWNISIELLNGQPTIVTKLIEASKGMLSGIGRRMTSLIFGANSGKNTTSFKNALRYGDLNELYILCDKSLQKWKILPDNNFTLTWQSNMEKIFYESYINNRPNFTKCNIMFQDASITKNALYILAIVEDDDLQFVVGEVDTHSTSSDLRLKSFHILPINLSQNDAQSGYRIFALDNQHAFYIHNPTTAIFFSGPTFELSGETKLQGGDRLIAHGFYENELIFFSLNHGILKAKDGSVGMSIQEENSFLMNTISEFKQPTQSYNMGNTTFTDVSNLTMQSEDSFSTKFSNRPNLDFSAMSTQQLSAEQTALLRFKAAFQLYLKKEERECEAILSELLSNQAPMDLLCVELSERLIDDIPAHDPRWAELNKTGKSLNSNFIISKQLNGKIRMHEYYINFLKTFQLWQNLNTTIYNGREILTRQAVEEHGEKLQCALLIRENLYQRNQDLLNSAIEYTTRNREDLSTKLVYPHDVFYRKVSKIDDIFNALLHIENEVIKNNSSEQAINYLIDTTYSFIKLLRSAQAYNQDKVKLYEAQNANEAIIELVRWTFLPVKEIPTASNSVINICIKQHKLCAEYGLLNCNSLEKKTMITQMLFELDQLIFTEYEIRMESIRRARKNKSGINIEFLAFEKSYEALKSKLIDVFIKNKQIDNALKLAENFVDFFTLVLICEMNNDSDMLRGFLDKFIDKEFAEFVVNYFTEKRQLNFLLKSEFIRRPDISKCLDSQRILSWIKDIKNENFETAAETLREISNQENDSYAKRKSLLSMSKLSLLASTDFNKENKAAELKCLNHHLDYLAYIQRLPQIKKNNFGPSEDMIPFMKPDKLIDLYICDESNEFEFQKAVDLLDYLQDAEDLKEQLRVKIFAQAILADNWNLILHSDNHEDALTTTKFFKTIQLLQQAGHDIKCSIPSIDDLINHQLLAHIGDKRMLYYLLNTCFESFSMY